MRGVTDRISSFFQSGSQRSVKAKKNVVAMLLIKGVNIVIGFLLVPLTIHYVDADTYGIWITLSSIVAWFSFMDIGLGNGLRNKLAEALAVGDRKLGKKYVSTTYAIMALIFIPLMFLLLGVTPLIDWGKLLNISNTPGIVTAISIIIVYFCVNFIFSLINIVLQADQRPADESLRTLVQQALTLAVIFIMTKLTEGDLTKLCICLCACPLAVVALFNFTLFNGRYRDIAPSFKDIDFKLAPSLLKLGVFFFIIQIAGIIQYQMTNFFIIHYFGATQVTAYNIAFKLFNAVYMVWVILLTPMWSATTDAIAQKDFDWVRNSVRKYLKIFALFLFGSLALLAISNPIYRIWVGEDISVAFPISLWVMVFNLVMMFGNIFVMTLNGASIVKVQTIACIISPFVFLGCFFLLKSRGMGVESILIASIIANFNGLILAPIQYYHHFKRSGNRGETS